MKSTRHSFVFIFIAALLAVLPSLWAGARKVHVQGKLTDSGGTPLSGAQTVTFKLYDAATAGTMVWTSGVLSVTPTSGGLFNVPLQDGTPSLDTVSFDKPYYVGITVGGDPEMTPRQEMGASALSHGSPKDFTVNNNLVVVNGRLGIGTTTPGEALDVRGNVKLGSLRALTPTSWGYSSGYPVVLVGPTSGVGNVSIGYNPIGNPYSGFTGDGREVLFRNGAQFVTPNSANTSFYLYNMVLKDGKVGIGTPNPRESLEVQGNVMLGNSSMGGIRALTPTSWGYSSGYPVVLVGPTSGVGNVSIGYNPIGNPYSGFTGDGREVLFRNGAQFVTPNSANTSFYLYNLVLKDGNVGIGTPTPQYALDVVGTIRGNNLSPSDSRLKKNVRRLPDDSLRKLSKLNGVSFEWDRKKLKEILRPESAGKARAKVGEAMSDPAMAEKDAAGFPETTQVGLIAQEVEKEFPSLVETDPNGVKSIYYMGVTAVLVEALKAQQKQIEELTSRVKSLEKR
jgi:hypothetical protein